MTESELSEESGWNAKFKIAKLVVPVLESYRQLILDEKSFSIPDWVVEEGECLESQEIAERWLEYLNKMIFAFNVELNDELKTQNDLSMQNEGLYLFAKYYRHLWD